MISGDPCREEAPMTERPPEEKPLPTIWRVPDDLWEKIEPILAEHDPSKGTGRPRVDRRAVLDAIIFRLRTGCQWNRLPKEFPDDSTVHRAFQRWVELGVLDRVWAALLEECEELGGVDWEWQAADGAMGKARFGGTSSARTPPTEAKTG
jgi:putative transposase